MAKATGVVASQLQKDADLNGGDFNSRPYYRMFLGLICSLPANDPTDGNVFGMLTALSNTLALVQVQTPWLCHQHDDHTMLHQVTSGTHAVQEYCHVTMACQAWHVVLVVSLVYVLST